MNHSLLVSAAILGLSACAHPPKQTEADLGAVTRGVGELLQRWSDAGEALDWDAVASTYANEEGFVWIEQGEVRYPDYASIVAGLDQARAMQAKIRNDISDIAVTPLGPDAAAYRTNYVLAVSADGFGFESRGVLSGVAVRRNGEWKLLQGSFSEKLN